MKSLRDIIDFRLCCPKTSVRIYHYTLRGTEDCSSQLKRYIIIMQLRNAQSLLTSLKLLSHVTPHISLHGPKVHRRVYNSLSLIPILSQPKPTQSSNPTYLMFFFTIAIFSTPISSTRFLFLHSYHKFYASLLLHVCHMPSPAHRA
jgi:hypothetical protein